MNEHATSDLGPYALGLVDERERETIARHLRVCAECREELRSHQAALAVLSEGIERESARALRDRIVARERRRAGSFVPRLVLAGSVIAAIVLASSVALSLRELSDARAQRDEYAHALAQVAEGARVVPLNTKTNGTAALVIPRSGQPMLLLDLPAPSAGKQYEAWVIRGGTPVRAGQVPMHGGMIAMTLEEPVVPGDVAAVTLEVAGGVDRPTNDPIVVGGA